MRMIDVGLRLGDAIDPFHWQTVLKPLSGTNAKNGAITPSLTPTMHTIHARCYSIQYSVMFIRGNGVTLRTQKVIQSKWLEGYMGISGGFPWVFIAVFLRFPWVLFCFTALSPQT